MVKLTSTEAWGPSQSRKVWAARARLRDLVFIVVFGVVSFSFERSLSYGTGVPIPHCSSNITSDTKLLFGNPIYLDGQVCWPDDLSVCLSPPGYPTSCCEKMNDIDTTVYEKISTTGAVLMAALVSVCILGIRILLWKELMKHFNHVMIDRHYWYKILWDSLLGLIYAAVLTLVVTDYMKLSVAAPRPIYCALKIFSSLHSSRRQWYNDNAQLSFPSGHASGTMAPLAYVTLLCLSDVRYLPPIVPSRSRSILGILATIPVMISFAIGVTRILDTWHFVHDVFVSASSFCSMFPDVSVGWFVGAGIALGSFYMYSGHAAAVSRTIDLLIHEFDKKDYENSEDNI